MRRFGRLGVATGVDPRSPTMPRLQDETSERASREQTEQSRSIDGPMAHGVFVRGVQLRTNAWTEVAHKLGRKPQGYVITRRVRGVAESTDPPGEVLGWPAFGEVIGTTLIDRPWTDRHLFLYSETKATVDLWVF